MVWLFFVAITTVVWVGHALNSTRNALVPVTIVYTGKAENIGTTEPLPDVVYVKVRDMGRRLRDVYSSHPQVTIDLREQLQRESGEIIVQSEVIRHALTDMLPGTASIQDIDPQEIRVGYHHQRSKTVPVVADIAVHPATQYQASGVIKITPALVKIFGSKAAIDTINYIVTEHLTIPNARDTIRRTMALLAPKDVRLGVDEVEITQPLEKYTEKSLQVPIRVLGAPAWRHIHLFPSTVTVRVQVPMRKYQDVSEINVSASVSYPHEQEKVLQVNAQCDLPYATHVSAHPQEVEYMIETIESEH